MQRPDFAHTLKLAEALSVALPTLRLRRVLPVPARITRLLFEFSEATRSHGLYEGAGEIARSLALLLTDEAFAHAGESGWQQVDSLIDRLLALFAGDEAPREPRARLVTPVSPTRHRSNPRVVFYLDNPALLELAGAPLAQAGFEAVDIHALAELNELPASDAPAAIVADLALCQLDPGAAEVFAALRERFDPPPHLFCLGRHEDVAARLDAVRFGATRFFSKPLDVGRLISVLKGVTAREPMQPFRVLLVEDDRTLGELYRMALDDAGLEALVTHNPLRAPALIRRFAPDVVVSDVYMPTCNGLELLAVLRQDDALADTPVILLSSEDDPQYRLEALEFGGDDFLVKPVDPQIFVAVVTARARRARALRRGRREYHRVLQRLEALERQLPDNFPARPAVEVDVLEPSLHWLEGYEVSETPAESQGARPA